MSSLNSSGSMKVWIKIGVVCGLLVSIIYPTMLFAPLPYNIIVFFVALFGPLLALASFGLYLFIDINKNSITAKIAIISNILAGMLITLMLLIQLAIRFTKPQLFEENTAWVWKSLNHVHLGIDVTWDIYIALGTLFFALSIIKHPKLGLWFASSGILIAIAVFILNLISFPTPPANAGLVDAGPLVGLWYFALTIRIMTSFKWIDERLTNRFSDNDRND